MRVGRNLWSVLGWLLLTVGAAHAQDADLLVAKSGPEFAAAGDDVTYALTVTNVGPDDAATVQLDDPLPAGMTFVSITQNAGPMFACTDPGAGNNGTVTCTVAQLNASQSAQFDLVVNIPGGTPMGTTFTNIASVSSATFDPNEKNNAAPAATTVPATIADVGVTKDGPGAAPPDGDVVYIIQVRNNGPDAADSFALTDTLPGTMTFVSLSQNSGPALACTTPAVGAGGTVNCSAISLPSGASATLTLTGHVPSGEASGTEFTNTATVSTTTMDNNSENDSATTSLTVSAVDVAVTKSAPATAVAGSGISYTLTVTNTGPDTATDVQLADVLPANTTFVSITQNNGPAFVCVPPGGSGAVVCSVQFMGAGASAQFTLQLNTDSNTPDGTVVSNTATVSTSAFDTNGGNDSQSAMTTVSNTADVAVTKTAPVNVAAGQNAAYTLTATNNGPDVAANVSLTDTMPAGTTFVSLTQDSGPTFNCTGTATVTCTIASLASGASASFSLVVLVDDAAADGSIVTNTADIATSSPESNGANNSASAMSTVVNRADLGVVKTGPATAVAGENITYTITASNAGPLADSATLTDPVPANTTFVSLAQNGAAFNCTTPPAGGTGTITCTNAAFASGDSTTFTLVLAVGSGLANGTTLTNTATIDGARVDPVNGNDAASAMSTVSNIADVAVLKSGAATVLAGQNLVYTLTANNDGASPALAVSLTDTLPANTTFVSLAQNSGPAFNCTTPAVGAAGQVACTNASLASLASATFTLTVQVAAAAPNGSTISNTAAISTSSAEATTANNSSTATTTVSNLSDVGIEKTGAATVAAGQNLAYTLTASNAGTSPALAVNLTDTLPANTTFVSLAQNSGPAFSCTTPAVGAAGQVACTNASLASLASATFTLTVQVAPATANGSTIANTATISTTSADADAANNSATSTATVTSSADLSLSKSGPSSAIPGQRITYTLTASNAGPSAAALVTLTDPLPMQTTFRSLTQNSGPAFTCSTPAVGTNGTVSCTLASFAPGATATFSLEVDIAQSATGMVTNSASIASSSSDASAPNNAASAGTAVGLVVAVPATSPTWLLLLALVLGVAAAISTRRARA